MIYFTCDIIPSRKPSHQDLFHWYLYSLRKTFILGPISPLTLFHPETFTPGLFSQVTLYHPENFHSRLISPVILFRRENFTPWLILLTATCIAYVNLSSNGRPLTEAVNYLPSFWLIVYLSPLKLTGVGLGTCIMRTYDWKHTSTQY